MVEGCCQLRILMTLSRFLSMGRSFSLIVPARKSTVSLAPSAGVTGWRWQMRSGWG